MLAPELKCREEENKTFLELLLRDRQHPENLMYMILFNLVVPIFSSYTVFSKYGLQAVRS